MKNKFFLAVALVSFFFLFRSQSQETNQYVRLHQLFNKADTLFYGEATEATDSVALSYYNYIIAHLELSTESAVLLFNSHERSGILKQGLGYATGEILPDYYTSLQIYQRYQLADSLTFRLLLSIGNIHYGNGIFDSSLFYLTKAESIIQRYPGAGLAGDVYNSLGALYSESGDYMRSGYYFNKALELTRQTRPHLKEAIFAMSANIASAFRLSGHIDTAIHLYSKLLDTNKPSIPVLINLSDIYLLKKMPDSALFYLHQFNISEDQYLVNYYNLMARAFMLKQDTAMTANYLAKALVVYKNKYKNARNNYYGATCKYFGDLKMLQQKPLEAAHFYQQAIIQYNYRFNDDNIFENPGNFVGDFGSYDLFEALAAKAKSFATIFQQNGYQQYFDAAKRTYDSAFALADYIKKSIDNDEARLFVADKVFDIYREAVDFLLTGDYAKNEQLLVQALQWVAKSRAASLAINLKENAIKTFAGLPDSLLYQEKNTRIRISRLKLQLEHADNSLDQQQLLSAINSEALHLQAINDAYRKFPDYYRQKFATDNLDIALLQKNMLNDKTAIVCYFRGAESMKAFVITQNAVVAEDLGADILFEINLNHYLEDLSVYNTGKMYSPHASNYLYANLVQPLKKMLTGITSLVIIPESELAGIPFEALQPANGAYLIEDYDVTYQYTLSFFKERNTDVDLLKTLAVAPFTKSGTMQLALLPFSEDELQSFPPESQLTDTAATKQAFLRRVENAEVVHLATHTIVNYEEPANSYIAFYDTNFADSAARLYAHELYNLQLPNTKLVFLSACETGAGKISKSEGVLSLSRGFAFAGCSNVITSLWKADDKSTAYLSKIFYEYVGKGYTYAKALQMAKKDILNDPSMSQFHAPQYWSHLIFIGDIQVPQGNNQAIVVIILIVVILVIAAMVIKGKNSFQRFKTKRP